MREEYTIGVEEEYQLVDAETGALRSRASDVLSTDWADEIKGELHETTVEIGTPVCDGLESVERELSRARFQAAATAAAEGLEIVSAGTHPFSGWQGHGFQKGSRYLEMTVRHDRIAREVNIFGMHIHVGVPERLERAVLMERVRGYIPHLLALSCSSPFLDAEDTGFASYRAILWRQYPYTGVPQRFESEEEYHAFIGLLLRSDANRVAWRLYKYSSLYLALIFAALVLDRPGAGSTVRPSPEPAVDDRHSARSRRRDDGPWVCAGHRHRLRPVSGAGPARLCRPPPAQAARGALPGASSRRRGRPGPARGTAGRSTAPPTPMRRTGPATRPR